jgi:uncharacterized metal-binding protein YceD (DUF177 family)
MTRSAPEFSRVVALTRLGREALALRIEANPEECQALARRFGLAALDRFAAEVSLSREAGDGILLDAAFEAEFVQDCVVTLEPVAGRVAQRFTLRYGSPAIEPEIELDAEADIIEPLDGDAIDIGEAVAQELSLALPAFPRDPAAEIDLETGPEAEPLENPFAALLRLRKPPEC